MAGPTADSGHQHAALRPSWWAAAVPAHERGTAAPAEPAWAATVVRALAAAEPADAAGLDWAAAFAVPLRPLVADAGARVAAAAPAHPDRAEARAVADGYTAALSARLVRLATRTFVRELNRRRRGDLLVGADPAGRFADFVGQLAAPGGLAALLAEYPVLGRLLGQAADQAATAGAELLDRYAADRAAVVAGLFAGSDPGRLTRVEPAAGDPHRGGRSVAVLHFARGARLVYKPRSVAVQDRFTGLVDRLNADVAGLDLRAVAVLSRPGYGWLEFAAPGPCQDAAGVDRFYHRLGAQLALLYLTHAADVHCENLIAAGDQPVLIDLETLFHPGVPAPLVSPDPAARALESSVYRTALLPLLLVGGSGALDMSGVGGDRDGTLPAAVVDWEAAGTDRMRMVRRPGRYAGADNRPRLDGRDPDPAEHEQALLAGFRAAVTAIMRSRPAYGALLRGFAADEVRLLARPTQVYARLLDDSTHPDLLRAAADRDRHFGALAAASAGDPARVAIVPAEIAELWNGDVPYFAGRADAVPPPAPGPSGLDTALRKVADLGEATLREQTWIIAAALSTRRPAAGHRADLATGRPVTGISPADPRRLLSAACGLADQIAATAVRDADRVNWVGLELVDDAHWQVLPMGAGLGNGYLGVALFLTELAQLSGVRRYARLAAQAARGAGPLLAVLAGRPDLVAVVGGGAHHGLSGTAYALARLARLTGDAPLAADAARAVDLLAAATGPAPHPPIPSGATVAGTAPGTDAPIPATPAPDTPALGYGGWAAMATGAAGMLAAMCAVDADLELPAAAALADRTADALAGLVEATGGRCAPADHPAAPGFATGTAGIAWALLHAAARPARDAAARAGTAGDGVAGDPATRDALVRDAVARDAAARERYARAGRLAADAAVAAAAPDTDPGWCAGFAGITAARLAAGQQPAADLLATGPMPADLSLCHGELGRTDALVLLATRRGEPALAAAGRRRAAAVLDRLEHGADGCGTPGGIPTAGLLSGLAGIGHGLLRLGFPDQVPSVLLLDPAP